MQGAKRVDKVTLIKGAGGSDWNVKKIGSVCLAEAKWEDDLQRFSILTHLTFLPLIQKICYYYDKQRNFRMQQKRIFNHNFVDLKGIDAAIEELAAFHEAKEIVEIE